MCRLAASAAALGMASLAVPFGERLARAVFPVTSKSCLNALHWRASLLQSCLGQAACKVAHCLAEAAWLMCVRCMQCCADSACLSVT